MVLRMVASMPFPTQFLHAEAGSGNMRPRDLRRLASAHDFTWTDEEISDMIHLFGSNGDDKVRHLFNYHK